MKKSEIQTIIDTNIRNNVALIDKTEHADVEDALLNELYQPVITESYLTNVNFTNNANFGYNLKLVKQGGIATIRGDIWNTTNNIQGTSSNILTFNDTEFLPSDVDGWFSEDKDYYIYKFLGVTYLKVLTAFGATQYKKIIFSYPTFY